MGAWVSFDKKLQEMEEKPETYEGGPRLRKGTVSLNVDMASLSRFCLLLTRYFVVK
jgi:hypothetical protein